MAELLSIQEVARITGLHEITIRRYVRSGELEAVRIGRRIRVRREALDKLMKPLRPGSDPEPVLQNEPRLKEGTAAYEVTPQRQAGKMIPEVVKREVYGMSATFTVIHEGGVLRPLTPLSLPEHARVQVKIVRPYHKRDMITDRKRVYNALLDAGLLKPQPTPDILLSITEAELAAAADILGLAGSISDLIIAERAESY